jgi:protease-4
VDSPGGSYVASDTIWRAVQLARQRGKPVVASMGDMAASGGYFVSMGADRIVAAPGTLTGSIGVYAGKYVSAAMWEKAGVNFELIGADSGVDASFYSTDVPYSDAARAALERELDRIYADFVQKAADGRKMPFDRLEPLAHGRVWTGRQAKERGLVDDTGGFMQALAAVRELAHIDGPLRLVSVPAKKDPIAEVLAAIAGDDGESSEDVGHAAQLRAPRALAAAASAAARMPTEAHVLSAPVADWRFLGDAR